MADRLPLMAGNWKMNTDLRRSIVLASELATLTKGADKEKVEIAVFPPYTFLRDVGKQLQGSIISIGGQSCGTEAKGAFTAAVAAPMLKSIGCKYVLVGHSERRAIFGESDEDVNKSLLQTFENNMVPVLCVGETLEEYELGLCNAVCTIQLARGLKGLTPSQLAKVVIAYEPVWAIGTGKVATPEVAQSVHKDIRAYLSKAFGADVANAVRILYGGSVTADSVNELMAQSDIDGTLVGGASLTAESFSKIAMFNN